MLKTLSLKTVGDLNGERVGVAFQQHVARAIADAEDRPADKKPRTVVLTLEIVPRVLQDGACTDVEVTAKVKSGVPEHKANPVTCMIKHGGQAVFNDLSEDNPAQHTID